jgi:hypothetical protein
MAPKNLDAVLDIATALGIPIPDSYRESVIANFDRLLEQAALVMAAPLPNAVDDGSEFEP